MDDSFTIGGFAEELILQDEKTKPKTKNINIVEGVVSNESGPDISDVEISDKMAEQLCEMTTVGMLGVNLANQSNKPKKVKSSKLKRKVRKESYENRLKRILKEQLGLC